MATIRQQLQAGVHDRLGPRSSSPTGWPPASSQPAGPRRSTRPTSQRPPPTSATSYKGLAWDPNLDYHFPWQSGATGVGYNVASTGRDLTKVADLFDPAFAGKVTLLSEVRDTFALIHLMLQAQGQASDDTPDRVDDRRGLPGRPRLPQALRRQRPHQGVHRQRVPARLRGRRHVGGDRLVRRPGLVGRRGRPVRLPRGGVA